MDFISSVGVPTPRCLTRHPRNGVRMFRSIALSAVAACAVLVATTAQAQDKPAPDKPASWWDTFSIGGHVDGGITFNSRAPSDGINFGQLFGDRANTALLNQAMLTVQRPI